MKVVSGRMYDLLKEINRTNPISASRGRCVIYYDLRIHMNTINHERDLIIALLV